ncbi:mitotic spindle checkpoint protein Mad1 [Schizosaccharomyces cryophilus OY26]|uniref:Spindle assembly checkpoint component MAD1 n=1 Tax=Schizosaccharomyces cryophilus (strain OY26 / ATCC MYA-4695 / CBS 11777 / NBRC 106824 / NRRL Y48691) TaxID=653667 RepID=S9X6A8_SCHCR|nr:mitotic spindle checkpoint protein Mad1 [Schizosaccharomyces cryophilus OY26]EPY49311.1 mitotic spindle checkpoint protein Mad1 [Schizosaccharomyces cryophilus OY26]
MADSPRNPFHSRSQLPRFLATAPKKPSSIPAPKKPGSEKDSSRVQSLEFALENAKNDLKQKEIESDRERNDLLAKLTEEREQSKAFQIRVSLLEKQEHEREATNHETIERLRSDNESLVLQLSELKSNLTQETAARATELEKTQQELREKIYKVEDFQQRNKLLEENASQMEIRNSSLQEQLNSKLKESLDKEQQVQTLIFEIEKLKESVNQASDSLELKDANQKLLERIAELEKLQEKHLYMIERYNTNSRNIEIVNEEKADLEAKLYQYEDYKEKVAVLGVDNEKLQAELNSWKKTFMDMNVPELAAEKFKTLQSENKTLSERVSDLTQQLLQERIQGPPMVIELKNKVTDLKNENKETSEQIRRLQRQVFLANQEINLLRANLKSYDDEEAIMNNEKSGQKKLERIESLTQLIDEYKVLFENSKIYNQGASADEQSLTLKRPRNEDQEDVGYVTELYRENQHIQLQLQEKLNTEGFLRDQINGLEVIIAELRQEIIQMSELKSSKVLQHRSNPTLKHERVKAEQLHLLEKENGGYKAILEEKDIQTVPMESLELANRRTLELKKELLDRDKRIQRLKEIFSVKSLEFREAIYSLFGYKIEFLPNGSVRVTSMYSHENNTAFVFDGETSTMKLVGKPSSPDFERLVRFWCDERKTIPGMLAALTLELIDKNDQSTLNEQ